MLGIKGRMTAFGLQRVVRHRGKQAGIPASILMAAPQANLSPTPLQRDPGPGRNAGAARQGRTSAATSVGSSKEAARSPSLLRARAGPRCHPRIAPGDEAECGTLGPKPSLCDLRS